MKPRESWQSLRDNTYIWQVASSEGAVSLPCDPEGIREAMIHDLLVVWDFEQDCPYDKSVSFSWLDLVGDDPDGLHLECFCHPDVQSKVRWLDDGQIRLHDDDSNIRECMLFSGVWMQGFTPLEEVEVFMLSESFRSLIDAVGVEEAVATVGRMSKADAAADGLPSGCTMLFPSWLST